MKKKDKDLSRKYGSSSLTLALWERLLFGRSSYISDCSRSSEGELAAAEHDERAC